MKLAHVYHRPGPTPPPAECRACRGIGSIVWAVCSCGLDPNCSHGEDERECAKCSGTGRICPDCDESMGLEEPARAERCAACRLCIECQTEPEDGELDAKGRCSECAAKVAAKVARDRREYEEEQAADAEREEWLIERSREARNG